MLNSSFDGMHSLLSPPPSAGRSGFLSSGEDLVLFKAPRQPLQEASEGPLQLFEGMSFCVGETGFKEGQREKLEGLLRRHGGRTQTFPTEDTSYFVLSAATASSPDADPVQAEAAHNGFSVDSAVDARCPFVSEKWLWMSVARKHIIDCFPFLFNPPQLRSGADLTPRTGGEDDEWDGAKAFNEEFAREDPRLTKKAQIKARIKTRMAAEQEKYAAKHEEGKAEKEARAAAEKEARREKARAARREEGRQRKRVVEKAGMSGPNPSDLVEKGKKVFVGNIRMDDLRQKYKVQSALRDHMDSRMAALINLFREHGDVESTRPAPDLRFCFIVFSSPDSARRAVDSFTLYPNRKAAVDRARASLQAQKLHQIIAPHPCFYVRWPSINAQLDAQPVSASASSASSFSSSTSSSSGHDNARRSDDDGWVTVQRSKPAKPATGPARRPRPQQAERRPRQQSQVPTHLTGLPEEWSRRAILAIPVPFEMYSAVQEARGAVEDGRRAPPHIPLLMPFLHPDQHPLRIAQLQQALALLRPFSLRLSEPHLKRGRAGSSGIRLTENGTGGALAALLKAVGDCFPDAPDHAPLVQPLSLPLGQLPPTILLSDLSSCSAVQKLLGEEVPVDSLCVLILQDGAFINHALLNLGSN